MVLLSGTQSKNLSTRRQPHRCLWDVCFIYYFIWIFSYIGMSKNWKASQCLALHNNTLIARGSFFFTKALFYSLVASTHLPPRSIRVSSIRYSLVFRLSGFLCSKPANKIYKILLRPWAHELLDWCHNKVNIMLWTSTWNPKARQMIDTLMEESKYLKNDEEVGYIYQDHCIVVKHHDKP